MHHTRKHRVLSDLVDGYRRTHLWMIHEAGTDKNAPTYNAQVEYTFNYDTAVPKGDWLGVVAWGEEPTLSACVARKPIPEARSGVVRDQFEL